MDCFWTWCIADSSGNQTLIRLIGARVCVGDNTRTELGKEHCRVLTPPHPGLGLIAEVVQSCVLSPMAVPALTQPPCFISAD